MASGCCDMGYSVLALAWEYHNDSGRRLARLRMPVRRSNESQPSVKPSSRAPAPASQEAGAGNCTRVARCGCFTASVGAVASHPAVLPAMATVEIARAIEDARAVEAIEVGLVVVVVAVSIAVPMGTGAGRG